MRKLASLEKDIIVTVIVLIVVTIYLSIVNYSNHAQGSVVAAKQLTTRTQVLDAKQSEQIYVFTNQAQIIEAFPDFDTDVNWAKNSVVAYVTRPVPSPAYTATFLGAKREANYLNIKYRINEPTEDDQATITVIAYPALFISVPKTDLIAGSNLFIQFIDEASGQTKTLTLKPNEI